MKELTSRSLYNPPVSKELTALLECNFVASESATHEGYETEDLFA